jgi:hypothetical protein
MDDKTFIKIVRECKTMHYASRRVGMAYSTFVRKAKTLGCYNPNPGGKGTSKPSSISIPLNEILEGRHPQYQTYKLKLRLLSEGLIKDECSECGWNLKPKGAKLTPCELDHVDGDPTNHKPENLRMLCPNCHSLTKTYRFRRGFTNGIS